MDTKQPLSSEEIFVLAKKAYVTGQLSALLSGACSYECPLHYSIPANVPTDFERVIALGIYRVYEQNNDAGVHSAYKYAIVSLAAGNPEQVWIAYMVALFQVRLEQQNISPFKIVTPELVKHIKHNLNKNKTLLALMFKWQGEGRKEGLWQDIVTTNKGLFDDTEISFL